ncbi:MAG: helix-turn-helix transcriptional regulator [Phycisphaeraceae bacterium]|nr:helix-turn-helix transcriptional regulator [Phycisphaeraceae bacterium]
MQGILDVLRKRIERGDVSRYQIARDTGIDKASLSRFMHGHTGLNVATAEKLADYLGLEIIIRPKRRKEGR